MGKWLWFRLSRADKLSNLIKRTKQGDTVVQTDLGTEYALGSEVIRDYRQAQKWFRSATDKGNPLAQYNLGLMYAHGKSVPVDLKDAAHFLTSPP